LENRLEWCKNNKDRLAKESERVGRENTELINKINRLKQKEQSLLRDNESTLKIIQDILRKAAKGAK
jgi:hypothetical protein